MFKSKSNRGFTLVELMIVVAIIGVLAALASVGYTKYIRSAKMEELEQLAMEFAAGQQQFRSRHNSYYPTGAGGAITLTNSTTADLDKTSKLLETRSTLPPDTKVIVASGTSAGTNCPGATAQDFCIRVIRNFNGTPNDATDPTVYVASNMRPVRLNEGN